MSKSKKSKSFVVGGEPYTEEELLEMIHYYKINHKLIIPPNSSLTNIEDVDTIILNKLPNLSTMNINRYNKSLVSNICNEKLKSIHKEFGTDYELAYKEARKYGNKYQVKTLLECGKVKPYHPKNIKFGSIPLDKLLKYKNRDMLTFNERFEVRDYPFVYTGDHIIIHMADIYSDIDVPTIKLYVDGGIGESGILYTIAQNVPEDYFIYGDHLLLESLYLHKGIYYLSLS